MRSAPPVRVLCGPDVRWHLVQQLILAGSAATGSGWVGWHGGWSPAAIVGSALSMGVLVAACLHRQRQRGPAVLEWTGETWRLDGQPCRPRVRIDLGAWLLLQVSGETDLRWLPLDLPRCGAPAHLARAALHAHTRPLAGSSEAGGHA